MKKSNCTFRNTFRLRANYCTVGMEHLTDRWKSTLQSEPVEQSAPKTLRSWLRGRKSVQMHRSGKHSAHLDFDSR